MAAMAASNSKKAPLHEPEVHVLGEIVGGKDFDTDNAFCVFNVEVGKTWECVGGTESGQSQVDYPQEEDSMFVWNHPLDLHYYTSSLQGWPRIVFEVFRLNDVGRHELHGYGFCFIPTKPGFHELECGIWRPVGSSKDEIKAFFLESTVELTSTDLVFSKAKDDRCRISTKPVGTVVVHAEVVLRNVNVHKVKTS